ncbi:USP6 N-terminal-like protein isoform X5 [Oryctolagus cuniculus]|uniref:USP6 N-terminal-like protein isoform X5 n=1 Tax=Oryctolagus cuniculus TaxID=9986 RepID=UPI003879298B
MSSEQKLPQDSTLGAKCKQEMRRIQKWIKMMKNHRKYCGSEKEMKEQARLGASHFHHIDSTITWTFRNHLIFQERYRMNQHALFQVLMEYSVYNPEVGYSQGLSHVVGLLLVFMPEEDFLWALVQLMENSKHTMHGEGRCVPGGLHHALVHPVLPGWGAIPPGSEDVGHLYP